VQAISGRNSKQLAFLLNFIVRYIGVRKLSKTLTHVASTVIGEFIMFCLSHITKTSHNTSWQYWLYYV